MEVSSGEEIGFGIASSWTNVSRVYIDGVIGTAGGFR
jgi:hypothetical protein